MKKVQQVIYRVAVRSFVSNKTNPSSTTCTAHVRVVQNGTKKLPSGHYTKMEVTTSHPVTHLADGIYRLMGTTLLPAS